MGEVAFGRAGYYIILILQNATLIAAGTLFLILAGITLVIKTFY
jgi:hypothetical protein